jgi:hypothetical protein
LIDNIDVTITDALAVEWDYNGNAPMGPALAVEFTDANGAQHIQYYSAGKAEDWRPHESGEGFETVSGKTGFDQNCNLSKLMISLVEAGFPKEHLTGSVKVLIGTVCHVVQVAQQRAGLIRTGKNQDRPYQTLLVSKIHKLPDGVGVSGSTGVAQVQAAPAATVAAPAANAPKPNGAAGVVGDSLDAEMQGWLVEALMENPVIAKKEIVKIVFKKAGETGKSTQERSKAVIRAGQPDFLAGLAGAGISYTGDQITMAE